MDVNNVLDQEYKRNIKNYKKKKLINDLLVVPTVKPKRTVPLIPKNKKLKNPLKISKYVFQSKGLPTNITRSLKRQKLIMASILEQNARISRRPNTTSLAYLAKNKSNIKRMASKKPSRVRTYLDKKIDLGKRAKA